MVQTLWKTVWQLLPKLNTELPFNSAVPLVGIDPPELKVGSPRDICTPTFIVALFTIARGWKQLKCPSTGEWINKMGYIHTREYHTALKRKETLMQATTQINLENSMLREIKGQILYDSIYEILLLLFIC